MPVSGVDPDDVEAGRELLKLVRLNMGALTAKLVYKVKETDPRLEAFKQENGFLRVALKRNQEKAAPLGKLAAGWKGIILGFAAEVVKVVMTFGSDDVSEEKKSDDAVAAGTPGGLAKAEPATKAPEVMGPKPVSGTASGPKLSLAEKIEREKKATGYK
jgi:hypothetical protein